MQVKDMAKRNAQTWIVDSILCIERMPLEQFTNDWRKTKVKLSHLTNHNKRNNAVNQSELETKTCHQRQARENDVTGA